LTAVAIVAVRASVTVGIVIAPVAKPQGVLLGKVEAGVDKECSLGNGPQ